MYKLISFEEQDEEDFEKKNPTFNQVAIERIEKNAIQEKIKSMNIDFSKKQAMIGVFQIVCKGKNAQTFQPIIPFISQYIKDSQDEGMVLVCKSWMMILRILDRSKMSVACGKTISWYQKLKTTLEQKIHMSIYMKIGHICKDFKAIEKSYEENMNDLNQKFIDEEIVFIHNIKSKTKSIRLDELVAYSLAVTLKVGTEEEMVHRVNELLDPVLYEGEISYYDAQIYLLQMFIIIIKAARDTGMELENVFGYHYNFIEHLQKIDDPKKIRKYFIDTCKEIMKVMKDQGREESCSLIHQAKKYIKEHYHDKEMNIQKICQHLHISASYFSALFKQQTHNTFIKYLTQVRMEAARELLRQTDLKNFEIADQVGYSEPNYFSYSFKKTFGVSPSVYRKQALEYS